MHGSKEDQAGFLLEEYIAGFDQHLQQDNTNVHGTHRSPELLLLSEHCKHQLKSMFSEMGLSATFLQAEVQEYKHTTTNT